MGFLFVWLVGCVFVFFGVHNKNFIQTLFFLHFFFIFFHKHVCVPSTYNDFLILFLKYHLYYEPTVNVPYIRSV